MYRIGLGTDSHEFEEGKPLYLGGLRIDHPKGLKGHSDGDVILHAITDAILGAINEKDIGEIFSDKDPQWKGASSRLFLEKAKSLMEEKGYEIVNIDCVIIAEEPKISPVKEELKESISSIISVDKERISLKGKRPEGFQINGIMCQCIVLIKEREGWR